jgi:RHH-type proline utilization regulon transcriptional repressor/proline dehydrogenase/delta 1-pyrroline-5-carboxylate dehydrogenase
VSTAAHESDEELARRLSTLGVDRLRLLGPAAASLRRAANEVGIAVDDHEPTPHADGEMWRWVREQSVTRTIHRHGHLPEIQVHGVP